MTRSSAALVALSRWIDGGNAHRDPEAVTWGRLAKITEEAGEVIEAYIGMTGQNPRKGVTHARGDVVAELLDIAATALGAVEHTKATLLTEHLLPRDAGDDRNRHTNEDLSHNRERHFAPLRFVRLWNSRLSHGRERTTELEGHRAKSHAPERLELIEAVERLAHQTEQVAARGVIDRGLCDEAPRGLKCAAERVDAGGVHPGRVLDAIELLTERPEQRDVTGVRYRPSAGDARSPLRSVREHCAVPRGLGHPEVRHVLVHRLHGRERVLNLHQPSRGLQMDRPELLRSRFVPTTAVLLRSCLRGHRPPVQQVCKQGRGVGHAADRTDPRPTVGAVLRDRIWRIVGIKPEPWGPR